MTLFCDLRVATVPSLESEARIEPSPGMIAASIGAQFQGALFGCVRGNQQNVTAQIASKFALEAFRDVLDEADAERLVQEGLREANRRVYEYSARMLAASRITTTALLSVFDGERISVARTGDEEGYLYRNGELTPLFRGEGELTRGTRIERFLGANKHLLADIATLKVKAGDVVWLTTTPIPSLRTIGDIPYDDLFSEDIALELASRLRGRERILCATFLFDDPPIMLKREVLE